MFVVEFMQFANSYSLKFPASKCVVEKITATKQIYEVLETILASERE